MCSASRFTSKVSRHWLRKSSIAALSVGNSCAGNKLMASTSSSVRWVSASNRRRLSISSSKSRGDKAVRCPSERDPTARRASRIRHAPSPDRHADNRRCQAARAERRGTAAGLFHHQRMTMQIAMRTNALHQGVYRYNQDAALHRRQLVERGQARRDNFLMREKLSYGSVSQSAGFITI